MQGYLYCIQENGKPIYVGCTQNLSKRIAEHIQGALHTSPKQQPIHKYMQEKGIANFEFKVLRCHDFADNNEMFKAEAEYIEKFNTYAEGFNYNEGGNGTGIENKNPNARRIRCINSGEEFDTIQRACWKYNLGITEMSSHLTGKRYQNGIGKRKYGYALKFEYINR